MNDSHPPRDAFDPQMWTAAQATASITCIYCKAVKPRPRRGEHLILAGLGGRATIPDVCADCNARLGELDREFLRSTHIALHRYLMGPQALGEIRSPQFLPCEFGFVDVRLLAGRTMDLLPQILLGDPGIVVLASEPDQELANDVADELAAGTVLKIRHSVTDVPEHAPARLVIDRKRKSHLLRARSQADADALFTALRRGFAPSNFAPWQAPMELRMRLSVDVNVPGRCAAKMAFNMACAAFGPASVLEPIFDPVRAFIFGEDVISGEGVGENGELGARIDYRFVDPWIGTRESAGRCPPDVPESSSSSGKGNSLLGCSCSAVSRSSMFDSAPAQS